VASKLMSRDTAAWQLGHLSNTGGAVLGKGTQIEMLITVLTLHDRITALEAENTRLVDLLEDRADNRLQLEHEQRMTAMQETIDQLRSLRTQDLEAVGGK
jgi:hypothetical protein